jgi:demethylmenaquinone methyltransferase/2-methoxy-6-polyprenyl-1,4-benzoquinol methylase
MGLRAAISTSDGKRTYVRRLFATIADRYDLITVLLSYGQDRRWKSRLIALAALDGGDRLLDLACGTGDLLHRAAPRVRFAAGLDVTPRMLQLARRKGSSPLVGGDMAALPFAAQSFTVVTLGYGLRNASDLGLALREIRRVLAPGGRMVSLDFNRPEHPLVRRAYLLYLTCVGSALGLVLHGDADTYRYIPESIRLYPGAEAVARMMRERGFVGVEAIPVLGGLMTIHAARV